MDLAFKRVVIKLSGAALSGGIGHGLDDETIEKICKSVKDVYDLGIQICIVVGGGNFWRGRSSEKIERSTSDHMGMLATIINSLRLQATLENMGVPTRVQTAISVHEVAEPFIKRKAERHLEKGRIVIFGAGTGSPFFTTDTTAALRAAEMNADVILMAKNGVDGVYSADPKIDPQAKKYDHITYLDVLNEDLHIMDQTAITLCKDNGIDLCVFNMQEDGNIARACNGESIGTIISKGGKETC